MVPENVLQQLSVLCTINVLPLLFYELLNFVCFQTQHVFFSFCMIDSSILQVLSLSQSTVGQLTIGHVVNLASNDVHRFHEVCNVHHIIQSEISKLNFQNFKFW